MQHAHQRAPPQRRRSRRPSLPPSPWASPSSQCIRSRVGAVGRVVRRHAQRVEREQPAVGALEHVRAAQQQRRGRRARGEPPARRTANGCAEGGRAGLEGPEGRPQPTGAGRRSARRLGVGVGTQRVERRRRFAEEEAGDAPVPQTAYRLRRAPRDGARRGQCTVRAGSGAHSSHGSEEERGSISSLTVAASKPPSPPSPACGSSRQRRSASWTSCICRAHTLTQDSASPPSRKKAAASSNCCLESSENPFFSAAERQRSVVKSLLRKACSFSERTALASACSWAFLPRAM